MVVGKHLGKRKNRTNFQQMPLKPSDVLSPMWSAFILTPMGCYSKCLCDLLLKPSEYLSFPAHFSREFHGLLCEDLCLFLILSLFSESLGTTRFGVSTAHCWSVCQCYTSFYILYLLSCLFYRLKSLRLKTVPYFSSSFLTISEPFPTLIIFWEVKRPAFHYLWSGPWTMDLCRAINFLPHFLV